MPTNRTLDITAAITPGDIDREILKLLNLKFTAAAVRPSLGIAEEVDQLLNTPEAAEISRKVPKEILSQLLRALVGATHYSSCNRPSVSYLGPPLSYSYLATVRYFSETANLIPVSSIATVFDDVAMGRCEFGVVPIENSTDGRVIDTLSTFADSPTAICGEVLLPIHHCLLGQGSLNGVTSVLSKPQALSQCRKWLATHLPAAKLVEVSSTTTAAEMAANDPTLAAIASYEAGMHYGLKALSKNIEDVHNNVTRFAVVGRSTPNPTGNDKTSVMFQIPHRSGALADAMQTFQRYNLNLTWIESFPIRGNPNEYLFFVELEGHRDSEGVASALKRLEEQTIRLEFLGSYPKATPVT